MKAATLRADGMPDYEDKDIREMFSVKKTKKSARAEKRDERKAKDMTPWAHIRYALFWQLFVPNNGMIAWALFFVSNVLWIVKVLK